MTITCTLRMIEAPTINPLFYSYVSTFVHPAVSEKNLFQRLIETQLPIVRTFQSQKIWYPHLQARIAAAWNCLPRLLFLRRCEHDRGGEGEIHGKRSPVKFILFGHFDELISLEDQSLYGTLPDDWSATNLFVRRSRLNP